MRVLLALVALCVAPFGGVAVLLARLGMGETFISVSTGGVLLYILVVGFAVAMRQIERDTKRHLELAKAQSQP